MGWNALPNHNIVPVPSSISNTGFISHGVNNNAPIAYSSAPNYINVQNPPPYQRYTHIHNGYPIVSIPSTQNLSAVPVLVRPPHRPAPLTNHLATQQNIKLIQTAWNKTSGGGKKQKRIRTAFTSHQMMELEQEYARTRYLDRTRRIELAEILRLNERTIKIWFQNRRMKEKKDRAESLEEVDDDVTTTQSAPGAGVPMFQEPYQANNEAYNRMGVFVEEYPVSSTSAIPSMAETSMPQESYVGYAIPEQCPPPYHQVHLQVQQYSSPYSEIQMSPESTPQSESSISVGTSAPSDIADRNWDLSWIKNMQAEEE